MTYATRTTCRLCDGAFEDVLNLGDIYLSTFLNTADSNPPKAPLDLVRCLNCNLYQLRHTVDQDAMYREYWYQSGLNKSMVDALANVVQSAMQRVDLKFDDVVVDIGANDGTLLNFYPDDVYKVAFEPSDVGTKIKSADFTVHDYFSAKAYRKQKLPLAKIVTAIAMFYDLEEPRSFVRDVRSILAQDGVFVIQMMDLLSMLKTGDFPNICHEHLEYYSLDVLQKFLLEEGLEIFDVEYNDVNGGSIRVYAKHKHHDREVKQSVAEALIREWEFMDSVGDVGTYFRERVERTKNAVLAFVIGAHSIGYKVAVMGASTKGNTMLQYYGIGAEEIDHAAEVNPDKFGRRTVGSNIPIISEEESLAKHPDYYLILPWGFTDFFVKKLDTWMQDGAGLIVPLPNPRIIYKNVYGGLSESQLQ